MPCKRKLAAGQWWAFCGETDMGQSEPALCVECGGEYVLDPMGWQKRITFASLLAVAIADSVLQPLPQATGQT